MHVFPGAADIEPIEIDVGGDSAFWLPMNERAFETEIMIGGR